MFKLIVLKKSVLLSFWVLSFLCSAQKYVPFPTENAEWNIMYSVAPEYFSQAKSTYLLKYILRGDSTVNGKVYKKLVQSLGTLDSPLYIDAGLIREENKRIYYIGDGYRSSSYVAGPQQIRRIKECGFSESVSTQDEILLYDFNVKVGDYVQFGYYYGSVQSIDSIRIGDSYRKRYNTGSDLIVEGIGSIKQGLLGSVTSIPMCGPNINWEYICFSRNGETLYKNPAYRDCNSTEKWSDTDYLKTNTQWYYGQIDYVGIYPNYFPVNNYNSLKLIGDTTINGIKCHILSLVRGTAGCASYLDSVCVYQSNDTVFFYRSDTKKFNTLYVYGAVKGDSWTVAYPSQDVQVLVDSVSSVQALGRTLKVQYVTYSGIGYSYHSVSENSTVIENVGDINYFFKSNEFYPGSVCDEFGIDRTGLRCYVHPEYGTYKVGTLDCDYVTALPEVNTNEVKVYIGSSGDLKIESELLSNPCVFELLDVRGSVVLRTKTDANPSSVLLGNITNGVYIYRLKSNGKLLKTGKIVKK